MNDMGEGVIALINQIYTQLVPTVQNMADTIVERINVFAAIGALLYIFGNLLKQIYYSEEINFLPYMRPFIVLMIIPLSPTITDAIDNFSDSIRIAASGSNSNISQRIEQNAQKMQEAVDRKWDRIGNDEELYRQTFGNSRADDDSGWFPLADDLKLMFGKTVDDIKLALVIYTQDILVAIMYIAEACLLLISMVFKLVLKMGFPITICLTIFPGFTQNLANWFAKYLNFSLLPAIAAMYSSIAFALLNLYLDNDPVNLQAGGSETQNPEFMGFAYIGILLLSLAGYFFVPSMTSMLITVGGVGQIVSGVSNRLSSGTSATGGILGRSARSVAGAASGAVNTGTRAAIASNSMAAGAGSVGRAAATVAGGVAGAAVGAISGGINAARGTVKQANKNS